MIENNTGKIVLIVADKPDVVAYLMAILGNKGCVVYTAGNGEDGFEKATLLHPDLITLDITMPDESGIGLLCSLKMNADTLDIPIIIVTGVIPELQRFIETRKQVRPVADFFETPISGEQFLAKVDEILTARSMNTGNFRVE